MTMEIDDGCSSESEEEELVVMELSELEDLDILSTCEKYALIVTSPPAFTVPPTCILTLDSHTLLQGLDTDSPVLKIEGDGGSR